MFGVTHGTSESGDGARDSRCSRIAETYAAEGDREMYDGRGMYRQLIGIGYFSDCLVYCDVDCLCECGGPVV